MPQRDHAEITVGRRVEPLSEPPPFPRNAIGQPAHYRPPRSLRIHRPGEEVSVVALDPEYAYTIGRSAQNILSFGGDDTVSRVHGQLSCDANGVWMYADQRSRNGSMVLPKDRYERSEIHQEDLLAPYRHVAVGVGQVICLAKGRSRIELSEELPRTDRVEPPRWPSEDGRKLEAALGRAAKNEAPVFLLGRSGSGKTFVASQIHAHSRRAKRNFVPINCGRLPRDPTSLHSELLGHCKGAFTGALQARTGTLVEAHGGTVFLDEVESLPPEAQTFLLDIVEKGGPLRPLGVPPRSAPLSLDIRFISASKVPLSESGLRDDLCQRLSGVNIVIPVLEERREDIPLLAERLMAGTRWVGGVEPMLSHGAVKFLASRSYRGQIRELRDALQTAGHEALVDAEEAGLAPEKAVIHPGKLEAYFEGRDRVHQPRELTQMIARASLLGNPNETLGPFPSPFPKRPRDVTRAELVAALRASGGNQTHAAEALGMALNTLKKRMRELGVDREGPH